MRSAGIMGGVAALVALLGVNATAARADFVPAPGSPYALDNEPYSVNPGRFDGDGLTDLAVVHGTSSTVRVFLQKPGDGGFGLAAGSPFNVGSGPNFAAVADFNGDGKQDLAVSNYTSGTISVELGQGDGQFAVEGVPIPVGDSTGAIGGGDFNGDGRPDLAVARWNSGNVQIYLRKGDNTGFVAGASLSTGGTHPRYLAVGDLDGANGPDLAISNIDSNTVSVLLNQPGGGLAAAPGSPYTVGTQPQYVAIAPLDRDDLPDIASANYGSSNVTVLRRKDAGGFEQTATSPVTVGNQPVGIVAGDFRGGGRYDLATANAGGSVTILANVGGDGFTRTQDFPTVAGGSPYGIATGTFNDGDQAIDLAVTSLSSAPNALSIFLNRRPPVPRTTDATNVTPGGATLNGAVNPGGFDSGAFFEYGTTTDYGSRVPAGGEIPVGADRAEHAVARAIDGLTPSTTYHFRVVAKNGGGSAAGEDRTFSTPAGTPPPGASATAPQATLRAPTEVAAGTTTGISAVGSTPSGGLTYAFDLDGSGRYATDTKSAPETSTMFTQLGDVVVGVRITDPVGRTDTVRRTIHVTAPPIYQVTTTPTAPKPGQRVTFNVRELLPQGGGAVAKPVTLNRSSLATMTFGDDKPVSGLLRGVQVRDRAVSATGTFSHVFDDRGKFTVHVNVDDGTGYLQGVDLPVLVGRPATSSAYQPAIGMESTSVEQGYCGVFENATFGALSVDDVGSVQKRDVNPKNDIINVKPPVPSAAVFGGHPNFGDALLTPAQFSVGNIRAGSPVGNINLNVSAFKVSGLNLAVGRRFRQGDVTTTTNGTVACDQRRALETGSVVYGKQVPVDPKWQKITASCPGGLKSETFTFDPKLESDLVTQTNVTTRHTFFAINKWDFGESTSGPRTSGPEAYLPSFKAYHAYNNPGTFTIQLTSVVPKNLKTQVADWNAGCAPGGTPLNASKPDSRFESKTVSTKLRVLARYDRIKSRGLWLTTSTPGGFLDTDLGGVVQTPNSIYINTRRFGTGLNKQTGIYNYNVDAAGADGVLVIVPTDKPLRVVADQGEILGAATIYWQSGRQTLKLGSMPLNIGGTPGLVIPPATNGNQHDFGIFNDPGARIISGTGPTPTKGQPFYVNAAHPLLREGAGGSLELNVHMPAPVGPDGGPSDVTIVRDVRSSGRAVTRMPAKVRNFLDNVDVTLPAVDLLPGVLKFNGGKLSHHVGAPVPWQAQGGMTLFTKKIDMTPDSVRPGCPVAGGLGFAENGSLLQAGAIVDGLQIPIPNPPAPNPITALANPALEVLPPTATRPLDLFGCLTFQDYPEATAFQVVGCAGFLLAGTGKSIPPGEKLAFCPDQYGNADFRLTPNNSYTDPAHPGNRILRGWVVRVSGTVLLGPGHFQVAQAYLELHNDPFAVEAAGHIGLDIIPDHLSIEGNIFGYFHSLDKWEIGGSGSIEQDILCLPIAGCLSPSVAVFMSSKGFGFCVDIGFLPVGGAVNFAGPSIAAYPGNCDEKKLRQELGVTRALPRSDDLLRRPGDALRALGAGRTGTVTLGGAAGATIVVNGQGASPVLQVKDPSGKVVLDDTGAPLQGAVPTGPRPISTAPMQAPVVPSTPTGPLPQGIMHSTSDYHTDDIDLRNATIVRLRNPKKGKYTIVAKDGSAPITAISSVDNDGPASIKAGVVSGTGKRAGKKLLTLQGARVPAGTTLTVFEKGHGFSRQIAAVKGTGAQVNRHVAFTPAVGVAETRKLVATVSRNGIPLQRFSVGSYRSPAPKKAGAVKRLKVLRKGSRLTLTWKPAANVKQYIVTVALRRGLKVSRTVKATGRSLTLTEPLARNGATVSVQPVGPLWKAGPTARRILAPVVVKKRKRFVL